MLSKEEVFGYLDGFLAYDSGCTDSGIRDDGKRAEVREWLLCRQSDSEHHFSSIMLEYVNTYFTSAEAQEQGYGYEDLERFVEWFKGFMERG